VTDLRIGVIGAGQWGWNLVRNTFEMGMLRSVCDSDAGVRERVRAEFPGVEAVGEPSDLIASSLDAVIIAAPAKDHERLALEAIGAGRHVFIEKPLALNIEGGERIVELARQRNVVAFVGHLLLYHPAIAELLAAVRRGDIGEALHVRSRRLGMGRLRSDENVWWSFAPHDVSLTLAVFEDEPINATSMQFGVTDSSLCDFAYADLIFRRGRSAHIEVGWLDPMKSSRLDVFGTRGALHFEDSRAGARLQRSAFQVTERSGGLRALAAEPPADLPFEKAEPLRRELEAFIDTILSGKAPPSTAADGVKVLRALHLAEANVRRIDRQPAPVGAV
jgi:UDP-2-acetamido-3-amino-2,3-dideoxy-glucuronate N-acetyltransferase